jgi:hypothetical protein
MLAQQHVTPHRWGNQCCPLHPRGAGSSLGAKRALAGRSASGAVTGSTGAYSGPVGRGCHRCGVRILPRCSERWERLPGPGCLGRSARTIDRASRKRVPGPEAPGLDRDCLHAGIAGLAPVLAEMALTRELTAGERALSAGLVARLLVQERTETALYDIGLAGDVVALQLVAPGSEANALPRISDLRTPAGWSSALSVELGTEHPMSDVIMGTAGVMMTALWVGDHLEIAETGGVEPQSG